MINFIKQTPSVYSASRDFQLISRLYDVLYNSSKFYGDVIDFSSKNHNKNIAELKARTVNFIPTRAWDESILEIAAECFTYVMRYKGTEKAIEFCVNLLLRAYNISGDVEIYSKEKAKYKYDKAIYSLIGDNSGMIVIVIPQSMKTAGVIKDLLDKVLPIGITYRIIEYVYIPEAFTGVSITGSGVTGATPTKNDFVIRSSAPAAGDNEIPRESRLLYNKAVNANDITTVITESEGK